MILNNNNNQGVFLELLVAAKKKSSCKLVRSLLNKRIHGMKCLFCPMAGLVICWSSRNEGHPPQLSSPILPANYAIAAQLSHPSGGGVYYRLVSRRYPVCPLRSQIPGARHCPTNITIV